LRWPVSISAGPGAWVDTICENLSSRGFYCISPRPLLPGAETDCRISMPDPGARGGDRWIQLLCRVRVIRVQGAAAGYGLGCAIQDYLIVANNR
jgi:hypothetical protein